MADKDSIGETETRTYHVDRTLPEAPTDVSVKEYYGDVSLHWEKSSSEDCKRYYIYRREGTGEYEKIGESTDSSYKDQAVAINTEYSYIIRACDQVGNLSVKTEPVTIKLEPDTTIPTVGISNPGSVSACMGSVKISGKASDNRKLKKIEIYVADSNGKSSLLGQMESSSSNQYYDYDWDTGRYEDGDYQILVVAEDAEGNRSEETKIPCIIDNTPPEKVTGLTGTSTETTISVSWDAVLEEVKTYKIEFREAGATDVSDYSTLRTNWKISSGLKAGTEYTIGVYAVDKVGNEGEIAEINISTVADTTDPVITSWTPDMTYPIHSGTNDIRLYICANDNVSLGRGVLSYSIDGENYMELTSIEKSGTSASYYYDWNVTDIPDGKVTLLFRVYDAYGNSASREIEYIFDREKPDVPQNFGKRKVFLR